MRKLYGYLSIVAIIILSISSISYAKTVVLEGRLDSKINITQQMHFSVNKPLDKLTFTFALPSSFSNRSVNQSISELNVRFHPTPANVSDSIDKFGNIFRIVVWQNINSNAGVSISFTARVKADISAMNSKASFPLSEIPAEEMIFLSPSAMVQSGADEIVLLAKKLTADAKTEYDAVTSILNFIADNIKYTYNPPDFDALYTLRNKSGNCQNFAHLSMALLRAVGIPARIVGGISLKQSWKAPVSESSFLVQSMGQGGHAWIEIFFPDLGWLSYDPQQSKQFTSSRHIKQTHGLDSMDINDSWKGMPYVPEYTEVVDAKFINDTVSLKPKNFEQAPKSYLFSNDFIAKADIKKEILTPSARPPVEQPKKTDETTLPARIKGKVVEFGNMDFPTLVETYQIKGNSGRRILDKETAEFVTSQYVFAQAFDILDTFYLHSVSLAMHKFGGDGFVYIDLVYDNEGKPDVLKGYRSALVNLENIKRRVGYYWVDFDFTNNGRLPLSKGRYWIVLRYSGDVIMNWFYIPGNAYGNADDTRSTLKGYKWEDIQNYDFVFKVRGNY